MAGRRQVKWSELSTGQRTVLGGAAAAELALKIAALIDIKRRPAGQVRGPKALWRSAQVVNFFGPVAYFLFGRRK
jgi:Phospholipase_D-nuclease N-terminal